MIHGDRSIAQKRSDNHRRTKRSGYGKGNEHENKREERERRPNEIQIQKQKMSIFDENVLYGSRDLVLRTTY